MRVGLIRCTTRYDNMSFIIKTPYIKYMYVYSICSNFNFFPQKLEPERNLPSRCPTPIETL